MAIIRVIGRGTNVKNRAVCSGVLGDTCNLSYQQPANRHAGRYIRALKGAAGKRLAYKTLIGQNDSEIALESGGDGRKR
jgi:hypothetical protein